VEVGDARDVTEVGDGPRDDAVAVRRRSRESSTEPRRVEAAVHGDDRVGGAARCGR